jgi:hypothetical protein
MSGRFPPRADPLRMRVDANRLPEHKLAILAMQQERYHRAAVIPDHVTDALPPIVSARTKRKLAHHLPVPEALLHGYGIIGLTINRLLPRNLEQMTPRPPPVVRG